MKSKLLEHLDKIPPCICRLCGRKNGRGLTSKELQRRTGKSALWVNFMSRQPSWEKITVRNMILFAEACDVDPWRPRQKLYYLRRAFRETGFKSIARGFRKGYVEEQIAIRANYEAKRMAKGKPAGDSC
jgi:hypothetical protein